MQKEFLHLAYLLTKHECITLPGLGAFVVQPVINSGLQIGGIFTAPGHTLSFNPELKHNDGLLVSSIMKAQQITYNEANLYIGRFVEELSLLLKSSKDVHIPGIGILRMPENKILFLPEETLSCNVRSYGLKPVFMNPLHVSGESRNIEKNGKIREPVIWIPFNRKVFKTAVSVAATILLLFAFSTPLVNYRQSEQNAGIIPLAVKSVCNSSYQKKPDLKSEPVGSDNDGIVSESQLKSEEAVRENSVTATDVKDPDSGMTSLSGRTYYIIIGSLPTLKTAEKQLNSLPAAFAHADIVGNGERYRIYIEKFSDKKEAEKYLIGFRKDHPDYGAWLLSQKN